MATTLLLLLCCFVKNYILKLKVEMHFYLKQRDVRHIFNISFPRTSKTLSSYFNYVLPFYYFRSYTGNIPN